MGYTPENNPYIPGDPYSYDLKWIVEKLKKIDAQLATAVQTYGSPLVVTTAAEMTNKDRIYIYVGSEVGYTAGDWYYFDPGTQLWTSGGAYGGYPIDSEFSDTSTNALENAVLTKKLNRETAATIMPIYLGDYLATAGTQPASTCRVGNYIFAIDAYNTTGDLGDLHVFDYSTNAEVSGYPATVLCGHANSLAYHSVEGKFYIAPVFSYPAGTPVAVNELIQYDNTFSTYQTIATPTHPMSVSFDHVSKKLYYFDYDWDIYEYANGVFTKVYSIDETKITDYSTYNQDFAIYDGKFIITAPNGRYLIGELQGSNAVIVQAGNFSFTDNRIRWFLGEYEGLEFTEEGQLICINYVNMNSLINAFILEIPFNNSGNYDRAISFSVANFTLYITNSTIAKFKLPDSELRHLNQIRALILKPASVQYEATDVTYWPVNIFLADPVTVNMTATAKLGTKQIYVMNNIAFNCTSGAEIKGDRLLFNFNRGHSTLKTCGTGLNIDDTDWGSQDGALTTYGNFWNLMLFRIAPTFTSGATPKVTGGSSPTITAASAFIGGSKITLS